MTKPGGWCDPFERTRFLPENNEVWCLQTERAGRGATKPAGEVNISLGHAKVRLSNAQLNQAPRKLQGKDPYKASLAEVTSNFTRVHEGRMAAEVSSQ